MAINLKFSKFGSQVLLNFGYKIGSVLFGLILIPLTLKYLNSEEFGIWLTLSGVLSWFSFLDMGLGQGLRNKYAEAKAVGNSEDLQGYVSTAYFTVLLVSIVLIILFFIANNFVDWSVFMGISGKHRCELNFLVPLLFVFLCFQLFLKLITSIYLGDQLGSVPNAVHFFTQLFTILGILTLVYCFEYEAFLGFCIMLGAIPFIVLLVLNFYSFSTKYNDVIPKMKYWNKKYLSDIFGLGAKFFILQISVIVLFSTDNFIIARLFGASNVVPYNISFKYFGLMSQVQLVILTPYWSRFTTAFVKQDFPWIKSTMNRLVMITFILLLGVGMMFSLAPLFYYFWIGKSVEVSRQLDLLMMIYTFVTMLYAPYNYFINGTGKIALHMWSFVCSAILNIPMSIFFAKYLGMGVNGVLLGTIVSLLPHVFLLPLQYKFLLSGVRSGVFYN